jgi:hypothetical protein
LTDWPTPTFTASDSGLLELELLGLPEDEPPEAGVLDEELPVAGVLLDDDEVAGVLLEDELPPETLEPPEEPLSLPAEGVWPTLGAEMSDDVAV